MNEAEFLRGIEGEQQNGQDLVSGAEHLLRLKKQVGMTRVDDDLELEKEAGELAELANATQESCKGCGKLKTACMCKTATLAEVLKTARAKTAATHKSLPFASQASSKYQAAKDHIKGYLSKHPTARAAAIGGAATGGANAIIGAANSPGDRIGGAVRGGVQGAAAGAAGGALYHHLSTKLAEMREKTATSISERLMSVNPGLIAATGIGAIAGGLGTYLASRPQKDTGKSKAEEELEGKVEAQKSQPERGLLSKMHHRNTELEHGYAKAFREHPGKAAIFGTIGGAALGHGIGRLAGGAMRMRGGK